MSEDLENRKPFQEGRRDQYLEMARLADNEADRLSLMYKAIGAQQAICRIDAVLNRAVSDTPILTPETTLSDALDFWPSRIGNVMKYVTGRRVEDITIADFLAMSRSDLLKLPNFGHKSLKIIEDDLMANGLSLRP